MEPKSGDLSPEPFQHRDVPGNGVILVVATEYAPQPFSRRGNRFVHAPAKLLLDFLQFLTPTLTIRNASDFESPQAAYRTDVLKAQENERLWFSLFTLFPVEAGEASEPD